MADPVPAQKAPYKVTLEAGRTYAWCVCGLSARQPFCDGSHTRAGLAPMTFKVEETKDVWLCGCEQSGNAPYCDGTHSNL